MARVDDLVGQVRDERLRRELAAAVAELKKRQRFGLVFEEHLPETTVLDKLPIETGATVVKRSDVSGRTLFRVCDIADEYATLEPLEGGATETLAIADLLTVKRFGEPIYPSLTLLGETRRGPAERPAHAVINGENFHALQLLLYLYEGQADCIYIDPPYNTGARDWKYNNHYVDGNDSWRHSKWLSFMAKRLRLARRLLKPDGVLIVTIDEHEVHHLGMLLAQELPDTYRQMVTIVINQKGVAQGRLSRVEEFAFFCFSSDAMLEPALDDLLYPENNEAKLKQKRFTEPRWEWLLRGGTNSKRQDRPGLFFPIYIDPEQKKITSIGEPLPLAQMPDLSNVSNRTVAWPLRTDGSFGNWRVSPPTLRTLLAKGYVRLGGFDAARGTWTVLYLGQKAQGEIATGVLQLLDRDEITGEVTVAYAEAKAQQRSIKTVWHRASHDAGNYGSTMIRNLLGEGGLFSFPKSVYAVRDCLAAVTRNRPDALILDFFAGSGTTYHATCLLNAEDNGRRRSIMVTNNEVEADVAVKLHRQEVYRGQPEFEAHGIFEQVTRPRCEAVTTGLCKNGTSVVGEHIGGRLLAEGFEENIAFFRLDYLDADSVELGYQFWAIASALWLASGGVGPVPQPIEDGTGYFLPSASPFAVLFLESRFRAFADALVARPDVTHVWLVTDSEEAFAEMRAELRGSLRVGMLYRDYLKNFEINTER